MRRGALHFRPPERWAVDAHAHVSETCKNVAFLIVRRSPCSVIMYVQNLEVQLFIIVLVEVESKGTNERRKRKLLYT